MNTQAIEQDFLKHTQLWIENFNKGNIQYCIDAYTNNARMIVKGIGKFEGREEISNFWIELTKTAKTLEYINTNIIVLNESTIHLNADWKMNIGEGIITLEEWVKQDDGRWMLENDCFQVDKQY